MAHDGGAHLLEEASGFAVEPIVDLVVKHATKQSIFSSSCPLTTHSKCSLPLRIVSDAVVQLFQDTGLELTRAPMLDPLGVVIGTPA